MKTFTSLLSALALLSMTALLPLVNAVPVDEVAPRAGGAQGAVTIQCAVCLFTLCLPALWPCEYVCAASEFIASECRVSEALCPPSPSTSSLQAKDRAS